MPGVLDEHLLALLDGSTQEEIAALVDGLPPDVVEHLLNRLGGEGSDIIPAGPLEQALELDAGIVERAHLRYISDRLAQAVEDVENGISRRIVVSMPPRMGKSTMCTQYLPLWTLRKHPEWAHVLVSHEASLATLFGRQVRRAVEQHPELGVAIAPDAGAVSEWETTAGGGVLSRSVGGSLTGRGARVIVLDDPVKDFATAHSLPARQAVWDWWRSVAQLRLEPPFLALCVMTRWHEDDFAGRLLSTEWEGDPADWEVIRFPAIAEEHDVLGRVEGEPLLSPLIDETVEEASARWAQIKVDVGTYIFAALHQQRPAPAEGAIFDVGWWRFWTSDPSKVTSDGRVVFLDPGVCGGRWLDSWDFAFGKADGTVSASGSWVVGQRWVKVGPRRFLVAQVRERWDFTGMLKGMLRWCTGTPDPGMNPWGDLVHERLVEAKANGPAVIASVRDKVAGIKPITPRESKEARARAVTPEVESGDVFLPLPSDPGNEWVAGFLSEMRSFPHDVADDQVDALTQALQILRDAGVGSITVPRVVRPPAARDVAALSRTSVRRRR